ncbi:MAG TPA: protein translocase subunit SecD [Ignavibacteria bacterium]
MKKNLARIVLTGVFILFAIWFIYPTYRDNQLNKELATKTGQDSVDFITNYGDKLKKSREDRIKLGLDLKGGMYVVLDVDVIKFLEDIAKKKDDILIGILGELKEQTKTTDLPVIDLLVTKLNSKGLTLKSYYGGDRDDAKAVEKKLNDEIDNAIDIAVRVVRTRVDQYGVAEPQLQKIGNKRIIVELPGVNNPDEVRKLLQGTALLQFQLLKDPAITYKVMQSINKVLAGDTTQVSSNDTLKSNSLAGTKETIKKDTTKITKKDTANLKSDKKEKSKTDTKKDTTKSKKDTIKNKDTSAINTDTASAQDSIANMSIEERKKKFPFFMLVKLYEGGGADGYVEENDKPQVDFILKRADVKAVIPSDMVFLWSQKTIDIEGKKYFILYGIKKDAELTGKVIEEAKSTIDPQTNSPVVTMGMSSEGAREWARITGANINKRCAIVLDGIVYSAPVIKSKITGGSSQIEGMANIQEAKLLEIVLKAGALPAPLKIIEERSIGPSLGEDSINKGLTSSMGALLLVALFMIVYYKFGGGVADFALIINVFFVVGVMAAFKATLTLPGIAGLILTLGMAVDTNVLIFERIREEQNSGKPLRTCIDIGYKKAFSAIIDSHLTSVITGIILYQFGTGPIQGFALTLLIGIVVNLFSAIVITHFIFDILIEKGKQISFG